MQKKQIIVRDLQFYYAKLDKPVEKKINGTSVTRTVNVNGVSTTIPKMVYDVQLRFPKERVEEMSQYGKVRPTDDGQFCINVERNAVNASNSPVQVKVVDSNKNSFGEAIGNGSKGNVILFQYPMPQARNGVKTIIMALQVIEHVKYEPVADVDFDVLTSANTTTNTQVDF